MTNKFQCFNYSDHKLKYFNLFYEIIINPTYLSNISIILGIVFLITKHYSLIHSFMPILITNGVSILYYKDEQLLLSMFNNNNNNTYNNKIKGYIISIIIHFWLPLLIYILGKTNNILRDRKQSNIISSLLINCIFLSLYGIFMRKDQYIIFDMDENKVSDFIFCIYVPIWLIVTYIYFL